MSQFVVVENPRRWPLKIPGVQVVSAKAYLTDAMYSELRGSHVYNLCRHYGYQTMGYYVSLLAAARGHRPMPSVATIQEMRLPGVVRVVSEDIEELIQHSLRPLKGSNFDLSIYFGHNVAARYQRLSLALFNQFPAPFLRAHFERKDEWWTLERIRPIATSEIPESHRDFLIERAREFLARPSRRKARRVFRYDLAILVDPKEETPPSNRRAIRNFVRAARQLDIEATIIEPDDYGRIGEFDALFIRETTRVNHHTFRFSTRAASEGLVVVDDPESILRCSNKVYLAESFARKEIPSPPTLVVDEDDAARIEAEVGLPCVLKQPDSAFSQGVLKATTREELQVMLAKVLENSQLAIAQAFTPSDFDWRIGVLDGEPLYAARYWMAEGHWQIIGSGKRGGRIWGNVEAVRLEQTPGRALSLAVRAASVIGDGLYGVDIKQVGKRFLVMEVNDNPNLEAGCEDTLLGDALYTSIMQFFRRRLEARGHHVRGL